MDGVLFMWIAEQYTPDLFDHFVDLAVDDHMVVMSIGVADLFIGHRQTTLDGLLIRVSSTPQPSLEFGDRRRSQEHGDSSWIGGLDLHGSVVLDVEKHIVTCFEFFEHCVTGAVPVASVVGPLEEALGSQPFIEPAAAQEEVVDSVLLVAARRPSGGGH